MKEFIEKLIGRLEENTIYDKQSIAFMNKYGRGISFISKNKAIEIVNEVAEESSVFECHSNGGGCCEWKLEDEEGFSNCRFTYQEIMGDEVKGFKYCPYCGKKIKVVE